jgi:hypothetical protein
MENRTALLAKTTNKRFAIQNNKIARNGQKIDESITQLQRFMNLTEARFTRTNEALNNHHLALKIISKMYKHYIQVIRNRQDFLIQYETTLEEYYAGLAMLARGQLNPAILAPLKLRQYLRNIQEKIIDDSGYELTFQHLYQYYAEPLITFTNSPNELILQIPILLKRVNQAPMSLYSMETVPVPMDEDTYRGMNNEYTHIDITQHYMAVATQSYIPLTESQIRLCTRIAGFYFCKNAHLLRDKSDHICASAVFFEAEPDIISNACKPTYIKNPKLSPKVLDAGDLLVLSNLPKPWILVCEPNNRPRQITHSTYRVINRTELCECSLSAGAHFLAQTTESCDETITAKDGRFQTYYVTNAIIFDLLRARYGMNLESNLIHEIKQLQQNIPIYSWGKIDWFKTEQSDDDRIFNQENEVIEADLENILDIIVSDTENEIYKNIDDYQLSRDKFVKYFQEAEQWQRCSVIGSFLSWLNLLVIIIIIFSFKSAILRVLSAMPVLNDFELVPVAHADSDHFIFTLPPEIHHTDEQIENLSKSTVISSTTIITIICVILVIFYVMFKKLRRRSSIANACFPLYPLSKIIRGTARSDIFLEIVDHHSSETIWVHVAHVSCHPNDIHQHGKLTVRDLMVERKCCWKQMVINWNNVMLYDNQMNAIIPAKTAWISVFTPMDKFQISEENPMSIRIMGRVLDLVMNIAQTDHIGQAGAPDPPTNPSAPPTSTATPSQETIIAPRITMKKKYTVNPEFEY